jgi:ribosomal protein S18 acetylase RimI-like enzyme
MLTVVSRLNSAREIEKGSSGKVKFATLTTDVLVGRLTAGKSRRRHTVVDYDTGDPERLLRLFKGVDHIFGLGKIARDVQHVVGVVGFFDGAGSEGDSVTFGGKGECDGLANVGTCAEDEDDGGHDLMLVRLEADRRRGLGPKLCLRSNRVFDCTYTTVEADRTNYSVASILLLLS